MRRLSPLTEEEQAFAENHHSLVNKFLRVKRLSPADYYDVAVFGYVEAVQKTCRRPIAQEKQNFTALAFICMEHAVAEDRKYRLRPMRRGDPLSLDILDTRSEDDFSLYFVIPDEKQDTAKQVEHWDLIRRLLDAATPRERECIDLVCRGYEPREVSQILGIAPNTGRTTLYHFRRKAKAIQDDAEIVKCPYYETHRETVRAKQQIYNAGRKARWLDTEEPCFAQVRNQ